MRSRRRRARADPRIARDGCRARPFDLTRRGGGVRRRPRRVLETTSDGGSTAAAPFAVASLAAAAAAATGYVAAARIRSAPTRRPRRESRKPRSDRSRTTERRASPLAPREGRPSRAFTSSRWTPAARVEEHGMGLYASKDVHALETASSSSSSSGGGGFFGAGRARGGPVTLASVPLALALTSKACVEHEAVGECFRSLMDDDVIDERMAVMLLLILERRRGARSPAAPYVEAIPARFRTPLHYSADEMRGLAGTNLHAAASQQRKALDSVLRERVRPAGARLFRAMRAWERGGAGGSVGPSSADSRARRKSPKTIQIGVLGTGRARSRCR